MLRQGRMAEFTWAALLMSCCTPSNQHTIGNSSSAARLSVVLIDPPKRATGSEPCHPSGLRDSSQHEPIVRFVRDNLIRHDEHVEKIMILSGALPYIDELLSDGVIVQDTLVRIGLDARSKEGELVLNRKDGTDYYCLSVHEEAATREVRVQLFLSTAK